MKKGKKSENGSSSEAKNPPSFTRNGVFHHPARVSVNSRVPSDEDDRLLVLVYELPKIVPCPARCLAASS